MRPNQAEPRLSIQLIETENDNRLRKIEQLAQEIWTEHYTPIIGEAQVKYMLDQFQRYQKIKEQLLEGYIYGVVYLQDHLIGYFSVQPRDHHLFLSKIYLKSNQRGKGFFSVVLKFIEQVAKEYQKKVIELTVNKHNTDTINIYKTKGFEIVKPAVFDIGNGYVMDDYIMRKHI
ncbi:GNAT family N-acetyltransferase [Parvicella tangerina]|uniref:N-acetyltransferase domain-containing protein n=1 Tax=Parvicella tangerina TaxID=2829795 RepID=A0A916JMV3_9FLAO|nr:GNAT family N-acetyltransferase [Parvicella tangerina]CAG5082184.1 hypothetical protein CRYO30217_01831 [Parvicella tangerina]